MNGTKLTLLFFGGTIIAALAGFWLYVDERGTQEQLTQVDCATLWPTNFELQGKRIPMSGDQTCQVLKMVAAMKPNSDRNGDSTGDPWHYFGRIRIRPKNDAWFVVLMARRSENYKPVFSLRHRRGSGWSVIGMFDAEPVLTTLGVAGAIDRARLQSDSALVPTDQSTPMEGEEGGSN